MDPKGLSQAEAVRILAREGYNQLPSQNHKNQLQILLGILREPMLLLLVSIGVIYVFLGDTADALLLMVAVVVVIAITYYQEKKTENALSALKNLSSPRALVIRDGQQVRIAGREVVVGDLLVLQEGDRVPADAKITQSVNMLVDESLLTGESLPVRKTEYHNQDQSSQPGGDNSPFIFSGTLITQGHGLAIVTQTGIGTQMGKIGRSLQTVVEPNTLLKQEIKKIIKVVGLLGLISCTVVVLIFGLGRGLWLEGFLSGLTLSMSLLPEEFSVVLVLFLTLGAWRMSRYQVLTRNTSVVETLGAATVLCVDKTGTITQNLMQLQNLILPQTVFSIISPTFSLSSDFQELIKYAFLASLLSASDPLEKEIITVAQKYLPADQFSLAGLSLVKEYPLSNTVLAVTNVWQPLGQKSLIVAAKGAPETIAQLCKMTAVQKQKLNSQINQYAATGQRLLAVAQADYPSGQLPSNQQEFPFRFIGLLGFADPIRSQVKDAVKESLKAGIRTIMITGDYPGTAQYIARQIGLPRPDQIITGTQLSALSPDQLDQQIRRTDIFARIMPEQKLIIVEALKKQGHIVAMTGDGVNDAPALKAAHIGIAMGQRGTDVAREASDLVLLDDNFASIVRAVKMGRRIYANLQKAVGFILAVHIPIAGAALLPILFGSPPFLLPAHIAFLELIIDPACTLVFESEKSEIGIMDRPPRRLFQRLITFRDSIYSFFQGLVILLFVGVFAFFFGRTVGFLVLVLGNLVLIISDLSKAESALTVFGSKNKALFIVLFGTFISMGIILSVPAFRQPFHFQPISYFQLLWVIIAGLSILGIFELSKFIRIKLNIVK